MGWIGVFYRSTIGRKIVMAATGVILVGFVIGHMTGNLLAFEGPSAINGYSHLLHATGELLWAVRLVLLAAVILHIHSAWTLTRQARAARPQDYVRRDTLTATVSSRAMRWGGVVLLAFIIFHLLHLTTGTLHPEFTPGDVYSNLMVGFRVPAVTLFYLVAMAALALHLHHGVWSMFQTLGVNHPHVNRGRLILARVLSVLIPLGFAAVPLAFFLRWLP